MVKTVEKDPSDMIATLMTEAMCKRCNQYHTGCKPIEIITCTEHFLEGLKKLPLQSKGGEN